MDTERPTKRFRRCIIHIGTEKTGTTAIQQVLRNNYSKLLEQGVLYPRAAGRAQSSQWEFVVVAHQAPWLMDAGWEFNVKSADDQVAFIASFRAELATEFDANRQAETLIISSEHFHSRIANTDMICTLKDFLDPWVENFEIVVYFRRQDELAVSFLSTRLKSGVVLPVDTNLRAEGQARHYFEYDRIYENWAEAFGADAVHARLFEPEKWVDGDLVSDFQSTCKLSGLDQSQTPVMNRSLGREAFHFIQYLNAHHPNPPGPERPLGAREALIKRISDLFPGKYSPANREQARQFYDSFGDSNERLRSAAFPDLPAPLFNEDFNSYSDTVEAVEPAYADAVEIILKLWEHKNQAGLQPRRSLPDRIKRAVKSVFDD